MVNSISFYRNLHKYQSFAILKKRKTVKKNSTHHHADINILESGTNFFGKFANQYIVFIGYLSNLISSLKMNGSKGKTETGKIDIERVLDSKNPSLRKIIPKFIINYLKRIVHQDDLNEFLAKYGHLKDADLIEAGLMHFKIKFKVFNT